MLAIYKFATTTHRERKKKERKWGQKTTNRNKLVILSRQNNASICNEKFIPARRLDLVTVQLFVAMGVTLQAVQSCRDILSGEMFVCGEVSHAVCSVHLLVILVFSL